MSLTERKAKSRSHDHISKSIVFPGVERLIIFILYTHRSTPVNKRRETELPTTGSQVPTEPLDYRGSWLGDPVVVASTSSGSAPTTLGL